MAVYSILPARNSQYNLSVVRAGNSLISIGMLHVYLWIVLAEILAEFRLFLVGVDWVVVRVRKRKVTRGRT
jgi:hypothetical protein